MATHRPLPVYSLAHFLVLTSILGAAAFAQEPPASQSATQPASPARTEQSLAKTGPFVGKPITPIRRFSSAEQFVVFIDGKSKVVQLAGLSIIGSDADRDAARQFVENLLTGEQIHIELAEKQISKDGALVLGYVYRSPDGLFMNEELVRQGYARVDEKYDGAFLEEMLQYEARAKELRRGIWNKGADKGKAAPTAKPAPPSAAATGDKKPPEPASGGLIVYITDSGKKYHRQNCQWAKTGKPMALEEAKRMYEPCKVCKPPE